MTLASDRVRTNEETSAFRGHPVSRRALFHLGAAGLASAAIATNTAQAQETLEDSPSNMVAGPINVVTLPNIVSLSTPTGVLTAQLAEGATVFKDGPADLASIERADLMRLDGELSETGVFIAQAMYPVFVFLRATIEERIPAQKDRVPKRLETTKGPILFTDFTKPWRGLGKTIPLKEFRRGDEIVAYVRLAASWKEWVAMWVGRGRRAR